MMQNIIWLSYSAHPQGYQLAPRLAGREARASQPGRGVPWNYALYHTSCYIPKEGGIGWHARQTLDAAMQLATCFNMLDRGTAGAG